jgi:hypothetical protein
MTCTCPIDFVDQLTIMTNGLFSEFSMNRIQEHLTSHRYFLGLKLGRQPSWNETVKSYKEEIFIPIYNAIYSWDFDVSSPKVKKEDLYFRLSTHLYFLRQEHPEATVEEAAKNFCCVHGCDKQGKMLVNLLRKIS